MFRCYCGFIGKFFARIFSSNAAKQLASVALQAGKTAAKDIGMKAIDVSKTVAIDAGKKLVEKAAKRLPTPKPQVANVLVSPEEINNLRKGYNISAISIHNSL